MTNQRDKDRLALISEEAAEWFVRVKDGGLVGAERREYLRWLKASPVHVAEVLRISRIYAGLRHTKFEMSVTRPGAYDEDPESNVIKLVTRGRAPALAHQQRPNMRRWIIAAVLCAVTLAAALVAVMQSGWFGKTIETEASEWRHMTLSDGSVVHLGPRTRLRLEFDETQRVVQLSRGEAVFEVAKDPARPFHVNAGLASVRAVGTEFGIALENDRVIVTVAEGSVALTQNAVTQNKYAASTSANQTPSTVVARSTPVSAGEQVAVSRAGAAAAKQVNATRVLAWVQGQLIFESDTVAEAIDAFNRRNRVQIEIADPEIGTRPVRGVFDAADPESFAAFLAAATNVTIVRDKPGVLLLAPVMPEFPIIKPNPQDTI